VIVAVALGAVFGAMLVAVVVMGMVVVRVIMPAAAGVGMGMRVRFRMGVPLVAMSMRLGMTMGVRRVIVPMMRVVVIMVVVVMTMIMMAMGVAGMVAIGVVVVVGAALGLEGPHHLLHRAALAAHHLGQHVVVLDVDRLGRDLGRRVPVADMPGDAHQPQRVLGLDLQQALRRGLDQHQAAILQLDGVAVAERGGLLEIEQNVETAIGLERETAAVAVVMVERQRIDDAILPDGGLANDGGGAKHDGSVRS